MAAPSDAAIRQQVELYSKRMNARPIWSLKPEPSDISELRGRLRRLARSGRIIPAYIVQANYNVWRPGKGAWWYGLALITFDRDRMNDRRFMTGIVRKLNALKGTDQTDPELAYAARITTDERAFKDRRQLVPPSLTDGVPVYSADLQLYRERLERGYLTSDDDIVCLADEGAQGAIELTPWWIIRGLTIDATPPVVRELTSRSTAVTAALVIPTIAAALFTGGKLIPATSPTPPASEAITPASTAASTNPPPPANPRDLPPPQPPPNFNSRYGAAAPPSAFSRSYGPANEPPGMLIRPGMPAGDEPPIDRIRSYDPMYNFRRRGIMIDPNNRMPVPSAGPLAPENTQPNPPSSGDAQPSMPAPSYGQPSGNNAADQGNDQSTAPDNSAGAGNSPGTDNAPGAGNAPQPVTPNPPDQYPTQPSSPDGTTPQNDQTANP